MSVLLSCEVCAGPFSVKPYRAAKARFCSQQCGGVWHAQSRLNKGPKDYMRGNKLRVGLRPSNAFTSDEVRGEANPRWTAPIELVCAFCGSGYSLKRWVYNQNARGGSRPRFCSITCRDKDPERLRRLTRMRVDQSKGKENQLERKGCELLEEIGVQYLPQHQIGRFCVDAFMPSAALVVQFDGDYWHGNPAIYPVLSEQQAKRRNLDKAHDAYMRACGFRVFRIWEADLKRSRSEVLSALAQSISEASAVISAAIGRQEALL